MKYVDKPFSVSLAEEYRRDLEQRQLAQAKSAQRTSGGGDVRRPPRLILGDKLMGTGYTKQHHRAFKHRKDALTFYALLNPHPAQLWDYDISDPGFLVVWFTHPAKPAKRAPKPRKAKPEPQSRVILSAGTEPVGEFESLSRFDTFMAAYAHYSAVVTHKIAWAKLVQRPDGVYEVSFAFSSRYPKHPTWKQVSIPKNFRFTQIEKNRRKYGKGKA